MTIVITALKTVIAVRLVREAAAVMRMQAMAITVHLCVRKDRVDNMLMITGLVRAMKARVKEAGSAIPKDIPKPQDEDGIIRIAAKADGMAIPRVIPRHRGVDGKTRIMAIAAGSAIPKGIPTPQDEDGNRAKEVMMMGVLPCGPAIAAAMRMTTEIMDAIHHALPGASAQEGKVTADGSEILRGILRLRAAGGMTAVKS